MRNLITHNPGKEIYLLRMAVITQCILRCRYCFVKKTNRTISYLTARKAVELLLDSPGQEKVLIIYGGEPLLCFELVKKIINFSRIMASRLGKRLIISIGTNGILLNRKQLLFFKKTQVKLAISLDGCQRTHDKARIFKNGRGSFRSIYKKIPEIFQHIKKENVCVLFGVLPSSVNNIYENLIFLKNLGFDSFNIEPVESVFYQWSSKEEYAFKRQLTKFTQYLRRGILREDYVFLNCINRQLKNGRLNTSKRICPFFQNLEIYPDGEIAFSPFLMNSDDKFRCLVGNINTGFAPKYAICRFGQNTESCINCWNEYLKNRRIFFNGLGIYALRNANSISTANMVLIGSGGRISFKRYITEAKKRIFE